MEVGALNLPETPPTHPFYPLPPLPLNCLGVMRHFSDTQCFLQNMTVRMYVLVIMYATVKVQSGCADQRAIAPGESLLFQD